MGPKVSTSPGEVSPSQAHALSRVKSKGTDGVFELPVRFYSASIIPFSCHWQQHKPWLTFPLGKESPLQKPFAGYPESPSSQQRY